MSTRHFLEPFHATPSDIAYIINRMQDGLPKGAERDITLYYVPGEIAVPDRPLSERDIPGLLRGSTLAAITEQVRDGRPFGLNELPCRLAHIRIDLEATIAHDGTPADVGDQLLRTLTVHLNQSRSHWSSDSEDDPQVKSAMQKVADRCRSRPGSTMWILSLSRRRAVGGSLAGGSALYGAFDLLGKVFGWS